MNIWRGNQFCGKHWNMRCHYDRALPAEVKKAIQQYIRWLKRHYYLRDKLSVWFINRYKIECWNDDDRVFGTTLFPDDNSDIIVRVACGYKSVPMNVEEWDNHIGGVLFTLTHEFTHVLYDSCDIEYSDRAIECRCTRNARELLCEYAATHEHLV